MIVKNEQDNIEKAIVGVRDIIDEFIIVDTGSTDSTVSIIKGLGIEPHYFDWVDDFAAAKNYAKSRATGDWILFLDGDECINRRDLPLIEAAINDESFDAYRIEKRSYVNDAEMFSFNKCLGKYPEEEIEFIGYLGEPNDLLFKNLPTINFFGIIHETIGGSLSENGHIVKYLKDVAIHNYGRHDMASKNELYSRLIDKRLEANDEDSGAWYYKGLDYDAAGYFEMAEDCFKKAIDIGFSGGAIFALALTQMRMKNLIEAEENFMKFLKTSPREVQAWKNLLFISYYKKDTRKFETYVESIKLNKMIGLMARYIVEYYEKLECPALADYYRRTYVKD